MVRKVPLFLIALGVVLVIGLVWLMPTSQAQAQCGTGPSSCKTCHETDGKKPVAGNAAWHDGPHINLDCTLCHSGNKTSSDVNVAHKGLVTSLNDQQPYCQTCHADDLASRVQVYAAALGVTVGTPAPTSTPDPAIGAGTTGPTGPAGPPAPSNTSPENPVGNSILIAFIVVLIVGGGGYIYWNERLAPQKPGAKTMEQPVASIPGVSAQVSALLPSLESLSPHGLEALDALLEDPRLAEKLFVKLVELDLEEVLTPWGSLRKERLAQALSEQNPGEAQP